MPRKGDHPMTRFDRAILVAGSVADIVLLIAVAYVVWVII
jgi:hypothetical protein